MIEVFFVFIWIKIFSFFSKIFYSYVLFFNNKSLGADIKGNLIKFSFIGGEYFSGFNKAE